MKITLSANNRKQKKDKLQQRFDRLSQKLTRKQQQFGKFQSDMESLLNDLNQCILETNKKCLAPLTQLSDQLITFYSRKSLSQWHRDELVSWIQECNSRIASIDQSAAIRLADRFQQVALDFSGLSEQEQQEFMQQFEDMLNETEEIHGTESPFSEQPETEHFQQSFFNFDDDDSDFADFTPDQNIPDSQATPSLMDDGWIKKIFRATAQALHPDREKNPEQQAKKQLLMKSLLKARKNSDIFTLLTLYSEHVSGASLTLARQEMITVCEYMERQIDQLEEDKDAYIYEHPFRGLLFEKVYSTSSKKRNTNFQQLLNEIRDEVTETDEMILYLRNLTRLKEVLKQRRYKQVYGFSGDEYDDYPF